MNIFIVCLIIAVCIVYCTDVLQVLNSIGSEIARIVTKNRITDIQFKAKLLNCSLCQTFWITLIILLCTHPKYCYLSLLYAYLTPYILYLLQLIDNILTLLFLSLETLINSLKTKLINNNNHN